MNRGNRILLSCIYWAFVLYVFVPLLLMILMGFKDSKFIGFPIQVLDAGLVHGRLCRLRGGVDPDLFRRDRSAVDADLGGGWNLDCGAA